MVRFPNLRAGLLICAVAVSAAFAQAQDAPAAVDGVSAATVDGTSGATEQAAPEAAASAAILAPNEHPDFPNGFDPEKECKFEDAGAKKGERVPPLKEMLVTLWESTGIHAFLSYDDAAFKTRHACKILAAARAEKSAAVEESRKVLSADSGILPQHVGRLVMILVSFVLLFLGIAKKFEPLLLVPIGMGALLSNAPLAGINEPGGILDFVFHGGIETGIFPLIIFMGVGAMTDFGPLIANPRTLLLGGAAQFGIFGTLVGALALGELIPSLSFGLREAASIGIIGGADGPTSIYVTSKLAPDLLGPIAVAAYSYMALVPLIQPPIMRALTTEKERKIRMVQLRPVSQREKIVFPILVLTLCVMLLPSAAPLIGFLCFGNLLKECGVTNRLSDTAQNALINITTIFLGLGVGSKLAADKFLTPKTLGIIVLGLLAFSVGSAMGVLMAKLMNKLSKTPVNPLIGSAGVSAVPMAARVSQAEGQKADPGNFLLMHAMGPNVAGVIGSGVAAGVLLAVFGAF